MRRAISTLAMIAATFAAGAILGARLGHQAPTAAAGSTEHNAEPPVPMILQEADGDPLVHRAGPLKGVPFTIKVDNQFGNSEDFFVFSETLAPAQTIPFHMHNNAEELLILQEPGVEVTVGDKRGMAGAHSIVFIPRDTWISATNTTNKAVHTTAIFSRLGFESYMRAISVKPGEPLTPLDQEELTKLRTAGHAMYWDSAKGKYPPGVRHP